MKLLILSLILLSLLVSCQAPINKNKAKLSFYLGKKLSSEEVQTLIKNVEMQESNSKSLKEYASPNGELVLTTDVKGKIYQIALYPKKINDGKFLTSHKLQFPFTLKNILSSSTPEDLILYLGKPSKVIKVQNSLNQFIIYRLKNIQYIFSYYEGEFIYIHIIKDGCKNIQGPLSEIDVNIKPISSREGKKMGLEPPVKTKAMIRREKRKKGIPITDDDYYKPNSTNPKP